MIKKLVFAFSMSLIGAFAASIVATAAEKGDDVFLDDGDSEMDAAVPVPAPAEQSKAPAPKTERGVASGSAAEPPAAPKTGTSDVPTMKEELYDMMEPEDTAGAQAEPQPVPVEEEVSAQDASDDTKSVDKKAAAKPEKKKATKSAAKKPKKKEEAAAKTAGHFVTTKDSCPMLQQPAADSSQILTVKPSRKIWVEDVDDSWVRAFNKSGEPGYVSRDCVM